MDRPHIAIVCSDDSLRLTAARAFDQAPALWDITLDREPSDSADVVVAVGDGMAGDVQMDLTDPQRVVEDVRIALASRTCRVALVVGASGGCGATSVALHLAAEGSGRTCLVDLHDEPSCARRLGLDPRDVDAAPAPVPVPGGFRLWWSGDQREDGWIDRLRRDYERVIVDAPAGLAADLAVHCDSVVVVMMPTIPSATGTLDLLGRLRDSAVAVVTNRVGPGGETTRAELQRILGCRVCLQLPCSPGLRDAEDDGRLLTSTLSPWRRGVARLSAAVER